MTKSAVEKYFDRYERFFAQSLEGKLDADELSSLYAPEFIAATPAGVMTGKNDSEFRRALEQGYEQYRKIGTKGMRVQNVAISPIDELHCVAGVAWRATYAAANKPEITIDFEVHYLMQELGGKMQVFGWVSGDEQAALKESGVI